MHPDDPVAGGHANTQDVRPIAYVVSMGEGLEAFVFRELEALYGYGYRFVLFATKYKTNDVFEPKAEWPTHSLTPMRLLFQLPIIFLRMLFRLDLVGEAVRDGGFIDLVFATHFAPKIKSAGARQIHCHFGDHKLFIGYYCKRLTGLSLSVTIHAHEFYTNPNSRLFRRALDACDRIFPIAERWRERLATEYAVPASHMRLNRLFVDARSYRPSTDLTVIAVGRFTERKGFSDLLAAAQALADLELRFVFVGFGEIDLNAQAEELGVEDRVIVFPKMDQKQLRYFYQNADILCVPSITTKREGAEGIPVVLMEGMACGLPVVTTDCGAITELVDAIVVDEGAPSQLAEAIRSLASDPELRMAQGARNRAIVEDRFSLQNVERFCQWLDEIVEDAH